MAPEFLLDLRGKSTAVYVGGVLVNNKSPSRRGSWLSSTIPVI